MIHDQTYLELCRLVLEEGEARDDRTGVGTFSVFGAQARYDLRDGFPLLTTKKVLFPAVVRELLWFLSGSTNINDGLTQHTPIWDAWADEAGDLGPIYGYQWRNWGGLFTDRVDMPRTATSRRMGMGIDQISVAIDMVKREPNSRRNIVSAWNVDDLPWMALPPCHVLWQLYVSGSYLDLQLYQRSADLALGVPFNLASYSLLLSMIAQECGLTPRYFIHTFGDLHIYKNHIKGVCEQAQREPRPAPTLRLVRRPVLEMEYEDIAIDNYDPHGFIKFEVAR